MKLRLSFPFSVKQVDANAVEIVTGPNGIKLPNFEACDVEVLRKDWGMSEADVIRLHERVDEVGLIETVRLSLRIE